MQQVTDSCKLIKADIADRLRRPISSVTFLAELFVGIIIGGSLNIWYPAIRMKLDLELTSMGFLTYFPAIVAPAAMVFIADKQQYRRFFGFAMAGLFLVLFLIASELPPLWQLPVSVLGTSLSIFFWWASVGHEDRFNDVDPEDAKGGKTNVPLLQGGGQNIQT